MIVLSLILSLLLNTVDGTMSNPDGSTQPEVQKTEGVDIIITEDWEP
jgi:hypothetical protein